ncbi:DNA-processing protein DprA [bacterium]|nr:DNA-processing protein DprA [bacterium]
MISLPDTEIDAFLTLNASGLSPLRQFALLAAFGTATQILAASDGELAEVQGVKTDHIRRLREAQQVVDLAAVWAKCREYGVTPVPCTAPEFPPLLRASTDGTPLLFVQGTLEKRDDLAVAIVGTRKCTPYGMTVARRLAGDLARRGFTIVSGMARGIDAEAHLGALEAGGRTIAAMGSGPDITFPRGHVELRERIVASGAVITEYGFGSPPLKEHFPERNRIVAGLSLGVLVVEAPAASGALITARLAGEIGREVFAVPGDVNSPLSHGAHALIKDGARLVEYAEDVVEGLGILLTAVPDRPQVPAPDLPSEEQAVVDALSHQPRRVDEVVASCNLGPAQVTAALMVLEMKGLVRRLPGSTFVRL